MNKTEQLNYLKFRVLNKIRYSKNSEMFKQEVLGFAYNINGDCNKALKDLVDAKILKKSKIGKECLYSTSKNVSLKETEINNETFGVELEFASKIENKEFIKILSDMNIDVVKNDGNFDEYERREYSQWLVSRDGSIEVKDYIYDVEIVSRILRGNQGITELKMIMDALTTLKQFGLVKVNKTCGTHVHHSSKSIRSMSKFIDLAEAAQPMMDSMVTNWRIITDEEIRKSKESGRDETHHFAPVTKDKYYDKGRIDWCGDKYLNISIRNHKKNSTIEFRQHQGTFNFKKLYGWIVMGQKLIASESI